MKYLLFSKIFIAISILAITSFIKHNPSIDGNGTIGDVKYSLLPPEQFIPLNPGWLLLDGGSLHVSDSIFKKSMLHLDYGFPVLPDARGLFIRGMNIGRDAITGDDWGDRSVGGYQPDEFKKHRHTINFAGVGQYGTDYQNMKNVLQGDTRPGNDHQSDKVIEYAGTSAETRPRNIALYIYVKVN